MRDIANFLVIGAIVLSASTATSLEPTTPAESQQRQSTTPAATSSVAGDLAAIKGDIKAVRSSVAQLEERLKKGEISITRLSFQVSDLEDRNRSVSLDPASPRKFQRVDSSSGFFIVSVQDVNPYLDGYRVRLHIGNLTSARFAGFKLNATWGARFDWDNFNAESYTKWQAQKQKKGVLVSGIASTGDMEQRRSHLAEHLTDAARIH